MVRLRIVELNCLFLFQSTKIRDFLRVHVSIGSFITITCMSHLGFDKNPNLFDSCSVKIDNTEHDESLGLNQKLVIDVIYTSWPHLNSFITKLLWNGSLSQIHTKGPILHLIFCHCHSHSHSHNEYQQCFPFSSV